MLKDNKDCIRGTTAMGFCSRWESTGLNSQYNKGKWKFIAKELTVRVSGWKSTKRRYQGWRDFAKITYQDFYWRQVRVISYHLGGYGRWGHWSDIRVIRYWGGQCLLTWFSNICITTGWDKPDKDGHGSPRQRFRGLTGTWPQLDQGECHNINLCFSKSPLN